MQKRLIRERILHLREAQSALTKNRRDLDIVRRLIRFKPFAQSQTLFSYVTHRGEVDTTALFSQFLDRKRIIVPTISRRSMCLVELVDHEHFSRGTFGVPEPTHCVPLSNFKYIDVALIPGIAFDARGHRIGYGGGFFDRFLKKVRCTTIGLAYEFQIIDKVPAQTYDVAVDYIITERRIIRCHDQHSKPRTRRLRKSLPVKRNARGRE